MWKKNWKINSVQYCLVELLNWNVARLDSWRLVKFNYTHFGRLFCVTGQYQTSRFFCIVNWNTEIFSLYLLNWWHFDIIRKNWREAKLGHFTNYNFLSLNIFVEIYSYLWTELCHFASFIFQYFSKLLFVYSMVLFN